MATSAKFTLKLLIDEKKKKVVLAEANQDFVDVLISLLTLPMGKIAKLLENHKSFPTLLRCYKNLMRSVSDMGVDHFETEACKSMLMSPKSTKEIHCRRLKLNISATNPTYFYMCPNFFKGNNSCRNEYSNFSTTRCICGTLMCSTIHIPEEEQVGEVIGNSVDGVFVSCRSSFIVTDDLNVKVNSIGVIMKVVNDSGYVGFSDLQETIRDVGYDEVLTLLGCLFTSETPLTCAFLGKPCMTSMHKMLSPPAPEPKTGRVQPTTGYYVKVFVRKSDKEILYAECNEDFVNSLLMFLVLPLELACSLSNDNTILGCVGNLCGSPCRGAFSSSFRQFPDYYSCGNNIMFGYLPLLSPVYQCLVPRYCYHASGCNFARHINRSLLLEGYKIVNVSPIDPKVKPGTSSSGTGFMKRNTKFIVSSDLIISPMNSSSTIGLLKKMQVDISDLEEHEISINKEQLIGILRASLITSSALTNGLSTLLLKKPKEET